ncbi:flagellar export chaperone FliS [Candidatus Symbiobacter mobilis]|uniref:Flagellar secretion chaperone FliS n=1 Tax=Candidatus Symbiobacter mobilis CR TaxID=946483 RepID=U5NB69_9BURK|nr:flagellar export chaperone FliS [Candidatus Symbiobacter mobilis]AGX87478.1 flagellin protein FliS [Candidatus Symbiobacter mobilis CR]
MFTAYHPRAASAYQQVHVATSVKANDKHQIVTLLYDGLIETLGIARSALARGDIPTKCAALTKALRLMQEGLMTGLDLEEGGDLANNLYRLYDYCSYRLMLANARNDDAIILEVQQLIEPLAMAWKEVKPVPQGEPPKRAQAAYAAA